MRISDWSSDVCSSDLALVTGGNSGIGLGFARGLARAGADVVIWGRREDRNEKAVAELRQFGGRVSARVVDVSEEREIVEGVAAAVEEMGRLDCVVANAEIGRASCRERVCQYV